MDGMNMEEPAFDPDLKADALSTEAAPDEDDTAEMDDSELVHRAVECYRLGIDTSAKWRTAALEDLNFLAGEQWDMHVRGQREQDGRPALTVNRLPQFLRQITNEQRQSKPAITVNPVDSGGDSRTAEVLQGVIRNVEYTSNADAAYASGGQSAAATGLGYWDVVAEYESERSFDQKLTIRRIRNPLAVVIDPGAKEMAGDDARWCIISTDISGAEWKATYPDKELPRFAGWQGQGDAPADWVGKDGVRIHEYRYITETKDALYDLSKADPAFVNVLKAANLDVSTGAVLASEVGQKFAAQLEQHGCESRKTTKRKACWAKIAGSEVVERGELAGYYLQLVRVVGTELEIDGEVIYEGVVRHSKDPQRILNYAVSAEMEAIALAPKSPWLIAEGQISNYKDKWETANTKAHSHLPYKAQAIGGVLVPPPQRIMGEANVSAITNSRMQAADDLKATSGIYDAALGAKSNEQSGRAILARQSQGQTANFHFQDNLGMAIRYTGRILIDLIPHFYTGPRIIRILGEDGEHEMVPVNGQQGDFRGEPAVGKDGKPLVQLDAGRYDVAVSMGPSYQSRRQEASAQLLELIKVNPQISQIAGDLLVKSMDIPGGDAIADRMQKLLPPEIRPADKKQPPAQVLSQQLQAMNQQHEQLVQALHDAHNQLDSKDKDNAAKERIALIQVQAELTKTAAALDSKEALALLNHQMALISKRLELDGLNTPPGGEQPQGATNGGGNGPNPGDAANGAPGGSPGAGPSPFGPG